MSDFTDSLERKFPNRLGNFGSIKAKATYYPDFIRIWIPIIPIEINPKDTIDSVDHLMKYEYKIETGVERSIRRTRKTIKDYVLCNQFDLFVTFTFSPAKVDRVDINACKVKMNNWLKNQKRRNGKFAYIIVPELHKDGALHFHALLRSYTGKVIESIDKDTGLLKKNKYGQQLYALAGYTLGWSDVKYIDDEKDSQTKVGFYIQKYITKDMLRFKNKNRYWCSRSLIKPIRENNPQVWYLYTKEDRFFEVDFGYILEFDSRNNSLVAMMLEGKF